MCEHVKLCRVCECASYSYAPFSNVARTSIIKKKKPSSIENNVGREPRRKSSPFLSSHALFWSPWLWQETLTQHSWEQATWSTWWLGSFDFCFKEEALRHLLGGVELVFFILAKLWSSPGICDNPNPLSRVLWNAPHCLNLIYTASSSAWSQTLVFHYPPNHERGKGVVAQPLSFHNAPVNWLAREHVYRRMAECQNSWGCSFMLCVIPWSQCCPPPFFFERSLWFTVSGGSLCLR